jgi:hypothetical protein
MCAKYAQREELLEKWLVGLVDWYTIPGRCGTLSCKLAAVAMLEGLPYHSRSLRI